MSKIYLINLPENIDSLTYSCLYEGISDCKKRKVVEVSCEQSRLQMVTSDLLLKYIALKEFNLRDYKVYYGELGKPFIKGDFFSFNISHSSNMVVCAVGKKHEYIGVDIEKIVSPNLDVAKRFFTTNEYRLLVNSNVHMRISNFYKIWTIKESVLKLFGKGLTIPLNSFDVTDFINYNFFNIDIFGSKIYLKTFTINADYKVAFSSTGNELPENIEVIPWGELFYFVKKNVVKVGK